MKWQAQEIRKKMADDAKAADEAAKANTSKKELVGAEELGTLRLLNPRYGL